MGGQKSQSAGLQIEGAAPPNPAALAGPHQGTLRDKVRHLLVLEGAWNARTTQQGHRGGGRVNLGSPFSRAQRWGVWGCGVVLYWLT